MGLALLLAMTVCVASNAAGQDNPPSPAPGEVATVQPEAPAVNAVPPAVTVPPLLVPQTAPTAVPAPGYQVETLLIKQVRGKIVLYRKSAWHWQGLLGQRLSPGGNIWAIGSLQAGNKLLATWQSRSHDYHKAAKKFMQQRIQRLHDEMDYMSRVMGKRWTRTLQGSGDLELQFTQTKRLWQELRQSFSNPPQKSAFLCIHGYEGSWPDQDSGGNGHYGGVQFGKKEWLQFGYPYTGKLWAYQATPTEQLWAAYRYWQVSGFNPWPQTARDCGLL